MCCATLCDWLSKQLRGIVGNVPINLAGVHFHQGLGIIMFRLYSV